MNNIIIYETYYETSKKVAKAVALILANSKVYDVENAPKDISHYNNIIAIFSFHGMNTAEKTIRYLKSIEENAKDKTLGLIGVGLSEKDLKNYEKSIQNELKMNISFSNFVSGELRVNKLTAEDTKILEKFLPAHNMKLMDMGEFKVSNAIDVAASIKEKLDKPYKKIDNETLKKTIHEFILTHNTCTLATGANGFIRATPIEYVFLNDSMYFITEGGMKFKGLLENPNVCICIYDNYKTMQDLRGLQITGIAEMIDIGSKEYIKVINEKNLNMDNLNRLPVNLNMIKVRVSKYEFLNSYFKKSGFDAKQTLTIL